MEAANLPDSLWVYSGDEHVGTLYRTEPLEFDYSAFWLTKEGAFPLHPNLPVAPGRTHTPYVHAFFENLLPEGDQRKLISMREHVSSVFGLLAAVGGESAGAYTLVPEGKAPEKPVYQSLTWEQVSLLVHAGGQFSEEREEIEEAAAGMPRPRMSISGAQLKMLLYIDEHGAPWRPMGTSPSTHILKPDIVRADISIFATAVNETLVMRAAQMCGLPTANVTYQPIVKACLVERYDRVRRQEWSIERLWQADLCQLAGKPSDTKYELDGGPTFAECFKLIGKLSGKPGVDQRNLLRWLFFNLCVGNNDSHAKNLSMIARPDGLRLAPFYDMMCTRVYAGLGPSLAMSIGGEFEPGKIGQKHLNALAASIEVAPKYVARLAKSSADQIVPAILSAVDEISPLFGPNQRVLAERIVNRMTKIVKQTRNRLVEAV